MKSKQQKEPSRSKKEKRKETKPEILCEDRNQREKNEHRERFAMSEWFQAFEKKSKRIWGFQ
jgi:hypothetical protein